MAVKADKLWEPLEKVMGPAGGGGGPKMSQTSSTENKCVGPGRKLAKQGACCADLGP